MALQGRLQEECIQQLDTSIMIIGSENMPGHSIKFNLGAKDDFFGRKSEK